MSFYDMETGDNYKRRPTIWSNTIGYRTQKNNSFDLADDAQICDQSEFN